ncbi:MBOAT, membrane-bound O-acyltransferase family-domain-containing protein [Globomyces pollinis-pini]|nr:MBOAT, membrane-bound O-acyltransferase family-domain-containing protein [Globomyces pollinis-pini]
MTINFIYSIADTYNLKLEVVRFGLVLISGFPLAFVFSLIPSHCHTIKHSFSFITTSLLTILIFSLSAYFHLISICLLIYLVAATTRSHSWSPILCFSIAIAKMSYVHMNTQYWNYNNPNHIDYSSMMMVLMIKLSSFGYCAHDGTRNLNDLDSYQKSLCIRKFPSLVEYFGYMFCFVGSWVGPGIEFNHYQNFITSTPPYDIHPKTAIPALKCFLGGVFFLLVESIFASQYHFKLCLTDQFLHEYTLLQKCIYILVAGVVVRSKFYAVWKLSESVALIAGIGFSVDPNTHDIKFDAAENVNVIGVEFGENAKMMIDSWNKFTANWLKRYVYNRVRNVNLKLPITFFISAFWHGFYSGYYLSFLSSVFLTQAGRTLRKQLRPLFITPSPLAFLKPIYDILTWIFALFVLNYLFIPFHVQAIDSSLLIWGNTFYIGHVFLFLPLILFDFIGIGKVLKKVVIGTDDKTKVE